MDGGGKAIRVAAADAQPLFLDGIRAAIESAPALDLAFVAATPAELARGVFSTAPDVAVVGLPQGALIDPWLAAVASPDRVTELLLLVDTLDEEGLAAGLRVGARGVASRNVGATELVAAVDGIASGATYLSAVAQELLIGHMRRVTMPPTRSLTVREQQVLTELANGKSTAAIGETLFLGHNTVKTHLQRIYEKLGVTNRAGAVREAMRRGWVR